MKRKKMLVVELAGIISEQWGWLVHDPNDQTTYLQHTIRPGRLGSCHDPDAADFFRLLENELSVVGVGEAWEE